MSFLFSSILFPLLFSSLHFLFFTSFILFILPVLLSLSLFLSSLLACSWSWCPVLFPSRHSLLVVSSLSLSSLLSCFWSFSLLVILSFLSLPCLFPLYFLAMTDNGSVLFLSLCRVFSPASSQFTFSRLFSCCHLLFHHRSISCRHLTRSCHCLMAPDKLFTALWITVHRCVRAVLNFL